MRHLTLVRLDQNEDATFGHIVDEEDKAWCVTLELPWLGNLHDVSCIPSGTYTARLRFSPEHGYDVYELANVPDRENIEIHIGNFHRDSLGCILLGTTISMDDGEKCVMGSRAAFTRFMAALRGAEAFTLSVLDPVLSAV